MKHLRTTLALTFALSLLAPAVVEQQQAAAQEPVAADVEQPRQIEITILGMSCPFCVYGVQQKLQRLDGVAELEVVLETGVATLRLEEDADISNELLDDTVEDAGFEVAKIIRNFESEFPDLEPNPMEGMR